MWRCSRRRPSGSGTRRLAGSWRAPRAKRTTRKRGTPPSVPDGRAGRGRLRSELRHRAGPVRKSDDRGIDVEALTSSVRGRGWRSAPAAREIRVLDPLLVRTTDPERDGAAVSCPQYPHPASPAPVAPRAPGASDRINPMTASARCSRFRRALEIRAEFGATVWLRLSGPLSWPWIWAVMPAPGSSPRRRRCDDAAARLRVRRGRFEARIVV